MSVGVYYKIIEITLFRMWTLNLSKFTRKYTVSYKQVCYNQKYCEGRLYSRQWQNHPLLLLFVSYLDERVG